MKQLFTKSVACIIISIMILSSGFSVVSFAEEDGVPRYLDNTSTLYYSKLDYNFGVNLQDSCGYVAAAMLLSYYDTYWNDSIIEDMYDSQGIIDNSLEITSSPGIYREDNWVSSATYPTYHSFIDSNSRDYFHLNLMYIGRDILHYQTTASTTWELNIMQVAELIEYHLYTICHLNSEQLDVNYCSYLDYTSEDDPTSYTRNMVIEKVKAGIPVLYLGFGESSGLGHFLIAYDYDSINDTLYFHSGWHNSGSMMGMTILSEESVRFNYAHRPYILWIDLDRTKLSHNCSNNYLSTDGETTYCMCNIYGHSSTQHIGGYTDYTSTSHTLECEWCGPIYQSHSYYYTMYSNTQHKVSCDCGYTYYQPHVVAIGPSKICLRCGCVIGSGGGLLQSVTNVIYLTNSGSYLQPDGIIMLSKEDVELYLAGELDIDALINQSNTFMR